VIGLVQLRSGDALSSDLSAVEIAVDVAGVTESERELAVAICTRAEPVVRVRGYETANRGRSRLGGYFPGIIPETGTMRR